MNYAVKAFGVALVAGLGIVGCAADRHAEIPQSASVVAEGNRMISYEVPRPGMIWVYNKGNGNMEYAGRVVTGDQLVIDPEHNKITLNGRNVNDKPLSTVDDKKIYYEPEYALPAGDRRHGMYP